MKQKADVEIVENIGSSLEVIENDKFQDIEVSFHDKAQLSTDVNILYIKSGEDDIKYYVENISKPDIESFVSTQKGEMIDEISEYIENQVTPELQQYAEQAAEKAARATDCSIAADAAVVEAELQAQKATEEVAKIEQLLEEQTSYIGDNFVDLESDQTIMGEKNFVGNIYRGSAIDVMDNSNNISTTSFIKRVLTTSGAGFATWAKAQNGYIRFGNGVIIQWGTKDHGSSTSDWLESVTFPTPFSSAFSYGLVAQVQRSDGTSSNRHSYSNVTSRSAASFMGGCYGQQARYLSWVAIGY